MEAVKIKNCATSVQLPAATSCWSLSKRDVKDRATATMNEVTATVYSIFLDLFIRCKEQECMRIHYL